MATTDPAALYPDVVAAGSLGATLRAVAADEGPPFAESESDPLRQAAVASVVPHRTALTVSAWAAERRWSVRGCESFQGLALVEGSTGDLTQIVRAARAWHDGTALDDIHRAAPFVHLTGRLDVTEPDPARLAESEWRHLRTEAGEEERPGYHALIEAAYAEPALRGLYPFTSHGTLRFSGSTRPRLTVVPVCLDAHPDGRYTVSAHYMGEVLVETTTAQEAVATAVQRLPSGLCPVAFGA
ncbi:DUF6193 family natural product biosynthesis protein [Embleya sp. NPDC050154]|uniref:DUF6193 family natural product biosynthesis protein n=1 Tax=unclassified Embleya TaxID=2699296 RepID=UPI0037916FAD